MKNVNSFDKFVKRLNESNLVNESVTLYRLVSVGNNEPLVVDTKKPGKYYFQSEKDMDIDVLKKKGQEYHVLTVETDSNNIDQVASEEESSKHGCKCVVLKNETGAKLVKTEPYKLAA